MIHQKSLQQSIDVARQQLYNLAKHYDLSHPIVLKQSMVLDELINKYNRLTYKRSPRPLSNNNEINEESAAYTLSYSQSYLMPTT